MLTTEYKDKDKKGERATLTRLNSPALISVDWSKLQHLQPGQSSDTELCWPEEPHGEPQPHNTQKFYISTAMHIMLNCSSLALIQESPFFFFPSPEKVFHEVSGNPQVQESPHPLNLLWSIRFTDDLPVSHLTDRFTRLALNLIRNNQKTLSLWCHFLLGWLCYAIINRKSLLHKQGGRLQGDFHNHLPFKSHLLFNHDWILFHFIASGVNWGAHNQHR